MSAVRLHLNACYFYTVEPTIRNNLHRTCIWNET